MSGGASTSRDWRALILAACLAAALTSTLGRAQTVAGPGACAASRGLAICAVDDSYNPLDDPKPPPGDEAAIDDRGQTVWLLPFVRLGQENVVNAAAGADPIMGPFIRITFNEQGARRLKELTEANIGHRAALLFDGEVVCLPVIEAPISGGTIELHAGFTLQTARELAERINAARAKSAA
jgi:preprotein translocase subunit SecD